MFRNIFSVKLEAIESLKNEILHKIELPKKYKTGLLSSVILAWAHFSYNIFPSSALSLQMK